MKLDINYEYDFDFENRLVSAILNGDSIHIDCSELCEKQSFQIKNSRIIEDDLGCGYWSEVKPYSGFYISYGGGYWVKT